MILADTSVWIDHLRRRNPELVEFLESDEVIVHPWVIGELALGSIANRKPFLETLSLLPSLHAVPDDEIRDLIESRNLFARGIGWVDAGILASCASHPCRLFTLDRRLAALAGELGVGGV